MVKVGSYHDMSNVKEYYNHMVLFACCRLLSTKTEQLQNGVDPIWGITNATESQAIATVVRAPRRLQVCR